MIIRDIRNEDLDDVKRVGQRYSNETLLGLLTAEQLDMIAESCMRDGVVLVCEHDKRVVGVIAGKFIDGLSMGRICEEVIWYIEPESRGFGLILFERFLDVCKEKGCKAVAMIAYKNDSFDLVERIYLRKGFQEVERRYYKEL